MLAAVESLLGQVGTIIFAISMIALDGIVIRRVLRHSRSRKSMGTALPPVTARAWDIKWAEMEERIQRTPSDSLRVNDYLNIIDCLIWRYGPQSVKDDPEKWQKVRDHVASALDDKLLSQDAQLKVRVAPLIAKRQHELQAEKATSRLAPQRDAELHTLIEHNVAIEVTGLTEAERTQMRRLILDHVDSHTNFSSLEQALQDNFGVLNRDWRRIATTETSKLAADRFLAACSPGDQVKWSSHPGACRYCRSMNGRIFTIVCPDNVEKHPESFVWVGKHTLNQGRRLTPYKRMSNGRLRLRIADELKIPAIPLHEHCSCMWVPYVYLTPDEEERIGRRLSFGHT